MNKPRFDPEKHHRRSVRWRGRDYSLAGAYFVTMCARGREHLFGRVEDAAMQLNPFGEIVAEEWSRTAQIRPSVRLDSFVVMPNHFHGILWIVEDDAATAARQAADRRGAQMCAQTESDRRGAQMCAQTESEIKRAHGSAPLRAPRSLGSIMAGFKSITTKRINVSRKTPGAPVWQRNYYERVLRDRDELSRAQRYIEQNPTQWTADRENPARAGKADAWEAFLYGLTNPPPSLS